MHPTASVLDRRGDADEPRVDAGPLVASWLGRIDYRAAWDLQRRLAAERADDRIPDQLLLLEHPAVLTLGRHADEAHVLASPKELRERCIEVIRVERGGEVTYHGPGQFVAYPILQLSRRGLLLKPLVRALEAAMADTCAQLGAWCDPHGPEPRKIGALGIRVERGVTYHGIALNVNVELPDFDLIHPCGEPGARTTSIANELGRTAEAPSTEAVARAATIFARALAKRLGATLEGDLP